jgi:PPM family protein phosphatase
MVPITMPYKLSAFGLSDIGLIRHNNEDSWATLPSLRLYILADGMGGHRAGEVASYETVKALSEAIEKMAECADEEFSLEEAQGIIEYAIESVNSLIHEMGHSSRELKGMGTTLCTLFFQPKGVVYANVGDSRIYRFRKGELEQLTHDHSLLRELRELGRLNECGETERCYKNVLTRAIGTEPYVEAAVDTCELMEDDLYIMCTDGLTDLVSCKEIKTILKHYQSIEESTKALISLAKNKGGYDNITIVMVKVKEFTDAEDISRQQFKHRR